MQEFFTRELHGQPKKVPLFTPDGKKTKKFLMVVGTDSDHFRSARAELYRDNAVINASKERQAAEIVACLVVGGDLGEGIEVTRQTAAELFYQAPYICDQIDRFTSKHGNFLEKK